MLKIARTHEGVENANGIVTVHLGPSQIVAALSIDFRDDMSGHDIEVCVERLEENIRKRFPEIASVFVKPQKNAVWQEFGRQTGYGNVSR